MRFLILAFFVSLFAKDISFDGYIAKAVFSKNYIVAGLENGEVHIKNFNNLKLIKEIKLPKIQDFMGEEIAMPIYSLDILGSKILILCEIDDAKRKLFIYDVKTDILKTIFVSDKTYMKAKFINKNTILFGLLSDELVLYNLKDGKIIYDKQIGNYVFSNYALNKNKTKVVVGDESGVVKVVNIKDGKKLSEFNEFNKDKTLSVDFEHGLIANSTSDKKVSIIDIKNKFYKVKQDVKFLPYGVAITPNGKYFAVQYDEKNDIAIFDMNNRIVQMIKGQTMPLNGMKFINNKLLFSYSADKIMINKIKDK